MPRLRVPPRRGPPRPGASRRPVRPRRPGRAGRRRSTRRSSRSGPRSPATDAGCGCGAPSGASGTCSRPSWSPSSCSRSRSGSFPLEQAPLVAARPARRRCCSCCSCWSSSPARRWARRRWRSTPRAAPATPSPRPSRSRRPTRRRGSRPTATTSTIVVDGCFDVAAAETRFVRRQRRDALGRLRTGGARPLPAAPRDAGPP